MPYHLSSRRRALYTVVPPAIVLALGVAIAMGVGRVRDQRDAVTRARDVLAASDRLLQRLTDAETGQRGFIITGDTAYLSRYRGAARDVFAAHRELATLTAGDDAQGARLAQLSRIEAERLRVLDERVRIRHEQGFDSARVALSQGPGRSLMDSARALVAEVQGAGEADLARDTRELDLTVLLLMGLVGVGTVAVAFTAWRLNRSIMGYAAYEAAAAAELTRRNHLLEEQATELELQKQQLEDQAVELETQAAELEASNEELQATMEALEQRSDIADALRAQAEEANRAKSEFLAMMSHELRTPLNAIAGYVDLMEAGLRGQMSGEQLEDLGRIKANGQHLLGIINDVLNFARLEAGEVGLAMQPVSIEASIEELHALVAPLIGARGLEYRVRYACGEAHCEVQVLADSERLRQILLNLLTNAIKFTAPGGRITVDCDCRGADLRLTVSDTGIGIPADRLQSVFEPFVQVSRLQWGSREGIGLGLAISRDLARRMGGDLTAESEEGKGSRFTLRLVRAGGVVMPGNGAGAGAGAGVEGFATPPGVPLAFREEPQ